MSQDFSPIQNHIISKLKNAKFLRYSQLQPDKVPNDLFNYHLQFLVKKEFVTKSESGYALAQKGIEHVADPYPVSHNSITSLFKINVITILSRVADGKIEILNQLRKSNPSYGKVGVMGGVVHKSELIQNAASRKLKQETGLTAEFSIVGMERRIMYKSNELFSDVMFPIAHGTSHKGTLLTDSDFGQNMWLPIEQAIKNESQEYDSIKGITTALLAIQDGSIATLPFFFSEEIQSDT